MMEVKIGLPTFDDCRSWIRKNLDHGDSWEVLKFGKKKDLRGLQDFLKNKIEEDRWPNKLCVDIWFAIIASEKNFAEIQEEIKAADKIGTLIDVEQNNEICIPPSPQSAWQMYKKKMLESGMSEISVRRIEVATVGILKCLSTDTMSVGPIKGLVVGNVQSGKTANMAGLMAMAADWGWNFCIILSGTIETLRQQTINRLNDDLNVRGCNIKWQCLERVSKRSQSGSRAQDCRFEEGSRTCYFTVTLKHPTRLEGLLEWIQNDPNSQGQMKILIIDDEADQAGINTKKIRPMDELEEQIRVSKDKETCEKLRQEISDLEERTKINGLIVRLVMECDPKGKLLKNRCRAINYISYTATPYANFLNEAFPESLYPQHFIKVLTKASEYFGPQEIFGSKMYNSDGLDIIREIESEGTTSEFSTLKRIHDGISTDMPAGLKNSLCWFICGLAVLRKREYKKPVSMLIHTSQKQVHHDNIYKSVSKYLSLGKKIIADCEHIFKEETQRFDKKTFRDEFPSYGRPDDDIYDYPAFEQIKSEIEIILNDVSHIRLSEKAEGREITYHHGIHLCVDNCSRNGIAENSIVRLLYPDKKHEPGFATGFIVIGGNTLSRGLTLEGLLSTYFGRDVKQCDTLMQMGRWFGYRKEYELLPRVWMTQNTQEKFEFLSELDEELREEVAKYAWKGLSPSKYAPKVLNTPKVSWLRITARNRMQMANMVDFDFTGTNSETIVFENKKDVLENNINVANIFISSLGDFELSHNGVAYVKRGVPVDDIFDKLLTPFSFSKRGQLFNEMDAFKSWITEVTASKQLHDWNVVVAGTKADGSHSPWELGNGRKVGKIYRNNKGRPPEGLLSIGVLRDTKDLIADIDLSSLDEVDKKNLGNKKYLTSQYQQMREKSGFQGRPLLIIYQIDKDSDVINESKLRTKLDAVADVIGISITIPGVRGENQSLAKYLSIKLPGSTIRGERDETDED